MSRPGKHIGKVRHQAHKYGTTRRNPNTMQQVARDINAMSNNAKNKAIMFDSVRACFNSNRKGCL